MRVRTERIDYRVKVRSALPPLTEAASLPLWYRVEETNRCCFVLWHVWFSCVSG